jgi:kumamolisin
MEVNNSYQWAPVDGNEIFDLSIVMPLRNEWQLDMWLLDVTNPKSPNYQKYLTHDQFVDQYAPTEDEIDWTINYFESQGIEIRSVAKNRMILSARGAVANINAVFNTEIHHYFTIDGDRFYAPAYELQVDDLINILGVLGLENRIQARPNFKILKDKNLQKGIPEAGQIQGYVPSQITTAYSVPSGLNGSGQTLAVFELDAFTMSDITGYEQAFNLPNVPIKVVTVDGGPGAPGGGAIEVTLDIQLMIALAPGAAQIIVYEGPNSGQGLVDTYNKIATDNLASSISTSWGMLESSSNGSITNAENQIFKQMAAQGQSIYSASGDSGAYQNGSTLSVQDPSTQPFMVSVGGTTLTLNSDNSYKSEKTWSFSLL